MSDDKKTGQYLCAIRIRGDVGIGSQIRDTLDLLRLRDKHICVILEDNKVNRGMLAKVKDYVTWGEIDTATFELLKKERGKPLAGEKGKLKPFFRLHPPRGGFERRGIKMPYRVGGALGYRGEHIKDLIQKMV